MINSLGCHLMLRLTLTSWVSDYKMLVHNRIEVIYFARYLETKILLFVDLVLLKMIRLRLEMMKLICLK